MKPFCLHIILCITCAVGLMSQPIWNSAQEISGTKVFRDLINENLFYYTPKPLRIAEESNGRPKFKLVQLRYTGTFATADQGASRNINLIQMNVIMPNVTNRDLNIIRDAFDKKVKLRPLPLKNAEGFLVSALGGEYRRLGASSGFESGSKNQEGLWVERNFTLRLDNHDAQILWEQVDDGKLALSVNYSYYAEFVETAAQDYNIKGDSIEVAKLSKIINDQTSSDSTLSTKIFHSDAFSIYINRSEYPESIQQIDVNESLSIAYPFLEIRCYDFSHDLRPDLGIKSVEIEAVSVSGQRIILPKINFSKSKPDQFVQQVKSDFAININKPFRYRVSDVLLKGDRQVQEWQTKSGWIGVLDISTLEENNPVEKNEIEFEVDLEKMIARQVEAGQLLLSFFRNQKRQSVALDFNSQTVLPIKSITVIHDKNSTISYQMHWSFADEVNEIVKGKVGIDNYVFLNIPAF